MDDAGFHLIRHKLFGRGVLSVSSLLYCWVVRALFIYRPIRRASCSGIIAQRRAVSAVMHQGLVQPQNGLVHRSRALGGRGLNDLIDLVNQLRRRPANRVIEHDLECQS